jgi:hypothetical protein
MNIAAGLVTSGVAVVVANEAAKMFGAPTPSVLPYIARNSTANKAILTVSALGLLFAGVKAIKGCPHAQ